MKLLDRILGRNEVKSVPYSFFAASGLMTSIVTKTDALDFYKSWVYACVAHRSMGIAKIDFKLYQMKGDAVVEVDEHELLNLLYRVNPETTKFNFMQLSIIYRDLLGSSPWILEKANPNDKYPSQMYIARPEFFKAERSKDGLITGYQYEIGTFKKTYSKEEVIFLKNYNPKNPDVGIGVIEAVRMSAQNDDYILQSNNSLLVNGARPGGYFETETIFDDDERKKILKSLRKKWGGYENNFKIQMLEGGLKFRPDMINPRDLEFMEGRKFNRDEIAGVFGVPKSLLTFDDVNLASAKTGEYSFNKWTLEPLATEIKEQLNEFLVPLFDDTLWLDYEPLATEDSEAVLNEKSQACNRWRTTNEIRAEEGLEPLEGGDYLYLPMSNLPMIGGDNNSQKSGEYIIKIGGERKVGGVNLKKQAEIKKRILTRNFRKKKLEREFTRKVYAGIDRLLEEKESKSKVVLKIAPKKEVKKKTKARISKDAVKAFYEMRMKDEAKLEGKWQKTFKDYFKEQEKRFIEGVEKSKKSAGEMGIDEAYEVKTCIEVINPLYWETVMSGVKQASLLVGEKPENSNLDFLMSWSQKVSEEIGQTITKTTIEKFDASMREGAEAGEGLTELTERVKSIFDFAGDTRAEMIARTETARGISESHRQTYKNYGFIKMKWLLAPNCCDACAELSNKDWDIDTIKDKQPVHPNCKCDHFPVV